MSAERKMHPHALLIPMPAQGHINPLMQLASKLVADGFLVTFLNTDFNHQRIREANKKGDKKNNDKIRMISIPDGLPPDDRRNKFYPVYDALQQSLAPPVVHKLIQDINDKEGEGEGSNKITCIIADTWICTLGVLQAAADHHQIPLAAFQVSLVSDLALRYYSPTLLSLGLIAPDGTCTNTQDKKVKFLPSMPPLLPADLPWHYKDERLFQLGIRMAEEISKIKWVLSNSFYELESPVVDELSKEVGTYPVGPLIPPEFMHAGGRSTETKVSSSLWTDEMECLEWLDKQPAESVIYVSVGSFVVWNERRVQEFALGLEATQRPFLWVVRPDLMDGSKAVFPSGFLECSKTNGCIVSWAPQLQVLAHPSIACFVTHCGWNSVQESITMGVPMLCSPHMADNFINCTMIVDVWKIGLSLNANEDGLIAKEELTKAVHRLLEDREGMEIKNEAKKLKNIARDATREGGSSYNYYHLFVKDMNRW